MQSNEELIKATDLDTEKIDQVSQAATLKQAALEYEKAFLELRSHPENLKCKAAVITMQSRHITEMKSISDQLHKIQEPYHNKMEAARKVITDAVLESKQGLIYNRFEAKFQKGRKTTSYKNVSSDLTIFLEKEVGKENASDMYDETFDRHTKEGNPSVKIKVNTKKEASL